MTRTRKHWSAVAFAALSLAVAGQQRTDAQVVIESISLNGELVASNLEPGTTATVEWASSVTGPWSADWTALRDVTADSAGSIHVSVPMFYRVRGVPENPNPARLAWIPPGTFLMGSPVTEAEREPKGKDETQHEVTISRGFWMGKYEVTQLEYSLVVGSNPSSHRGEGTLPVEHVSWYDAVDYCQELTKMAEAGGQLPDGYVYRLPTEAEWEYACRAGTTTAFHYGPELRSGMANFDGTQEYHEDIGTISNPSGISLQQTAAVGRYLRNAWGLYDMHGNVWEWCHDWFDHQMTSEPVVDPTGPTNTVDGYKVGRGHGWRRGATRCRSAFRGRGWATWQEFDDVGFRVVLGQALP